MGGGGTETTTTRTGSEQINKAVDTIGSQLNKNLSAGWKPYTGSLVPGLSSQTQQGVSSIMNNAGNTSGLTAANNWAKGTVNSGGYNAALTGAQTGVQNYLAESQADAPGYAALRAKAGDDTLRDVNSIFASSGRFGSGSHVSNATESLGNVYAGMDMQNYENRLGRMLGGNQALAGIGQTAMGNAAGAAGMAPGLYSSLLAPGQAMLGAGQIVDANAAAKAQDQARIYEAQKNPGWMTLDKASGVLSGSAGAAGQSTTTPTAPWWQQGLGAAAMGAGIFGSVASGGGKMGWWG